MACDCGKAQRAGSGRQAARAAFYSGELELDDEAFELGTASEYSSSSPEWSDAELQYSIVVSPTSLGDSRFRIPARTSRPTTLQFPFDTICFLEMTDAKGSRFTGSGTLIAPQVVLTAKHCLERVAPPRCRKARARGTPFSRVQVTPGADLSATTAAKQRPANPSSQTATPARFRVDPDLDYGVIILPRPFSRPSRFMLLQPRSDPGSATLLTIAGYPCDKPRGTMWGHSERVPVRGVSATHLSYPIDTCPGHSGSPVWLLGNNGIRLLLGVHTTGAVRASGSRCENNPTRTRCVRTGAPTTAVRGDNCGVRITCAVIDNILRWCKEFKVREPQIDKSVYKSRCR